MRLIFFFNTLFLLFLFACNRAPKSETVTTSSEQASASETLLSADFLDFYKKFHADSLYQMAHITFPLQGDKVVKTDSITLQRQTIWWQMSDWRMQHSDFDTKDYRVEVQTMGDIMVIERVMARAVNYGIERRFAKQPGGEWALIFYSDMQER